MKKMSLLYKIVMSALIALLFFACGKYEEGTVLSLRSPEKRLIGLWEFTSINIEGVEYITDFLYDSSQLRLSVSGTKDEIFVVLVEDNRGSSPLSTSLMELNSKCTEFNLNLDPSPLYSDITDGFYSFIPALGDMNTWTIKRLSADEWWISTTYLNEHYILKLTKLEQYLFNQ